MSCSAVLCGLSCGCVRGVSGAASVASAASRPAGPVERPIPSPGGARRTRGNRPPWRLRHEAELGARAREDDEALARLERALEEAAADDVERALATSLCWEDFPEFCRQAWHVVEPSTRLQWGWHHQLVACVLQALFEQWLIARDALAADENAPAPVDVRNVVFNLPPGSLKSRIIAVFFPVWCWLRCPGMKFICLSVNETAAMRDARASRDLIKHAWFQSSFDPAWRLKGDQDAISNFGNTAGGERLSLPSGSEIVGLRGDVVLMDDPNNPQGAENENERVHVNEIWETNQYNRVNDPLRSLRIGVQQRTNVEDWTGYVLSRQGTWAPDRLDGWLHVVLPAEFESDRRFVLPEPLARLLERSLSRDHEAVPGVPCLVDRDPRARDGESVHPARFTEAYLREERARWAGTGHYAGQMQQRPAMQEGARVQRGWLNFVRLERGVRPDTFDLLELNRPRPAYCHDLAAARVGAGHHRPGYWDLDWLVLSVDCAAKETLRGSQWGMLAVGGKGARRYVLDDRTRRGGILDVLDVLKQMVRFWRPDRVLVEEKAAGTDLLLRLREAIDEGDVSAATVLEPIKVVGNLGKEARLDACLPAFANGQVHLLDGAAWLDDLVDELCVFPNGKHDDRVDALTQVLNHYAEEEVFSLPDW